MSAPIRILIADDQALVRGALATLLGLEPDIDVVAQTGSGRAVATLAREHAVDVALLDIDMPDMDGLAAAAALTASGAPAAGAPAPRGGPAATSSPASRSAASGPVPRSSSRGWAA